MQADFVQSRQADFVQYCLKVRISEERSMAVMTRKKKRFSAIAGAALMSAFVLAQSELTSEAMFGTSISDTDDIEVIIDVEKDRIPISKYIYGLNMMKDMSGVDVTATKQFGAELSSYNWEINAANMTASEGYRNSTELLPYSSKLSTPALLTERLMSRADMFNIDSRYVTLQMMGYAANDSYGEITSTDSANRWAEVRFNKNTNLSMQPDIHDNMVYMDEYVSYLVSTYGYAADGGINGYFLDSEPEHWDENYAMVRSEPVNADELITRSINLANCVKRIDPTALVYGPSIGGIEAFVNFENPSDWDNAGKGYSWFIDYYLDKMRAASERAGVRLLDSIDLHFVSEAKSVILEPIIGTDSVFANEERMQAVRVLWDSNYTENSSTAIVYKQHTPIIPMVQASIRMYYPGTKLSFSEYNFGGGDHISGGLAQADVLGIFGEQNVYMACLKPDMENYEYQKAGINLYTNYDGEGASYGNIAVYADNGGDTMSSVYASVDDNDDASLKAIFINKNDTAQKEAKVKINSQAEYTSARIFAFDESSSEIKLVDTLEDIENNEFVYTMETLTAYLFEFDGSNIHEDEITDAPDETALTTVSEDEPEHVEVTDDTFTSVTEVSGTDELIEIVTSVSVVGTDDGGETITEIVTERVTNVAEETAPSEEPSEEERSVPKVYKIIVGVLVAAVLAAMVLVLVSDHAGQKK